MKKTALAFITCIAAVTLFTGCGDEVIVQNSGRSHVRSQPADTEEKIEDYIIEDMEEDPDLPDTDEKILVARQDPTIDVTAEEFQNRLNYSFNVPDGAQEVYYTIDTDSNVGTVSFILDGNYWKAGMIRRDTICFDHHYIPDEATVISCDFENDPSMKVHGAAPGISGYYLKYNDGSVQYVYTANWFLENEGLSLSLDCYADAPIDSMPVEVFQ
ncbi:MAG: hypothetical protein J5824_06340 [Lachnospiraceae bacterium]|nr:hypothetical protein [Lachnospiraceae bacterium]